MPTPFTILVVDDDESNRESLRRRLERRGYTIALAIDGPQALERIAETTFDLVILDVMMPGMSGLEVLDIVRKTLSHTQLPIIMATARDQSEDVVAALNRGANDYVTKPLDFGVVLARVQTQLLLKKSVDQILELEQSLAARNTELQEANVQLTKNAARAAYELQAAAKVQKAFLPQASPDIPGVHFAWVFEPCDELAGDSLNVLKLDADHVAFYVLDVSGHGVAASLLAVAAARLLSVTGAKVSIATDALSHALRGSIDYGGSAVGPTSPAEVANRLNQSFLTDAEAGRYLTLFYAVYEVKTRTLTYVSAGHPGAVRISRGAAPLVLHGTGLPIGVGESYEQQTAQLEPGDRLYLYSDGITEAMNPDQALFGDARLLSALTAGASVELQQSISLLLSQVKDWQEQTPIRDDITVLVMECE